MNAHHFHTAAAVVLLALLGASAAGSHAQALDVITIGTTDFPQSLDPATAIDQPSWEVLNHLYTGLTRQVPGTLRYELALAASHIISPDGLTHVFTVRPDAAFADGTPITAETFARSINRVITLGQDGAEFVSRFVAAVKAGPQNTVIFTLHIPLPDFEALIGQPPFYPLHPASYPADTALDHNQPFTLISNGPYRLEGFNTGATLTLVPDPAYSGPTPSNAGIVIRRYTLPIDLRRALLTHEVDIAWRALAPPDLAAIESDPTLVTQRQPGLQMFYLLLNQATITINNQESFADPALRHACALLVNRDMSAHVGWDGMALPADTLLPAELTLSAIAFPNYDYTQADSILEEAGYRPRRRPVNTGLLISTATYGDPLREAVTELVRSFTQSEIVESVTITDNQTATFIGAVNRGDYLGAIIGWNPHYTSPAAYLFALAHSSSPLPVGAGYASPALDALLEDAGRANDTPTRNALYSQVQRLLLDNYAIIPLWQSQMVIAYRTGISGIQLEANGWLRYTGLSR